MNKSALCKISDTLRQELAPTLPYDEREQVYQIADAIDSLMLEEVMSESATSKEALCTIFKDARTIYEVLGVH